MTTEALIRAALAEDLGGRLDPGRDLTTRYFVDPKRRLKGRIVAKAPGVICGAEIAARVFKLVDPRARVRIVSRDGSRVSPGDAVLAVEGGRGLLTAERTALNFLQHLSGIATLTAAFVAEVRGTGARVCDTRKTLPGWRRLAKHAVRCGGGTNHRMGLHDMVLVKDNHWAGGADVAQAVRALRRRHRRVAVQIEAATLAQVDRALEAKPDLLLLDNMGPSLLRAALRRARRAAPRVRVEISGGVSLATVRRLARLGPDRISVGRLTHSAPALDLSLEIE